MILNWTTVFFHCAIHKYCLETRMVGGEIYADFVQKFYLGINYQTDKCICERQIRVTTEDLLVQ